MTEWKNCIIINPAFKISLNLQNASFLENIVKIAVIDFKKSKFFETKIDSNGNLFAFKNKILDCRTLEIRDIKPNDYIMNNTGYDYPEYTDEDLKLLLGIIIKLFIQMRKLGNIYGIMMLFLWMVKDYSKHLIFIQGKVLIPNQPNKLC